MKTNFRFAELSPGIDARVGVRPAAAMIHRSLKESEADRQLNEQLTRSEINEIVT